LNVVVRHCLTIDVTEFNFFLSALISHDQCIRIQGSQGAQ
jgi:hypothetical protein